MQQCVDVVAVWPPKLETLLLTTAAVDNINNQTNWTSSQGERGLSLFQHRTSSLKTIFLGYQYENVLQMLNLPTLHRRRDDLCRVYFVKIKSNDHKLNALLPNGRSVSYALRLCNKLPIPRAKTNRYKNSLIPWCLEHFQIG